MIKYKMVLHKTKPTNIPKPYEYATQGDGYTLSLKITHLDSWEKEYSNKRTIASHLVKVGAFHRVAFSSNNKAGVFMPSGGLPEKEEDRTAYRTFETKGQAITFAEETKKALKLWASLQTK